MIEVSGLSKSFTDADGSTVVAVDDVSLTIDRGSIVGILGPNGAGKTTTIKCLLGLVEPTAGTVRINGARAGSRSAYEAVAGMLEGARNCYWRLTIRENLRFFLRHQGIDPRSRRGFERTLLERLGLLSKADEPVQSLSRGTKQKAALACTLIQGTPAVVLDEPTLGLDVETTRLFREELAELLSEQQRTVVVTSHDMGLIEELCDRVVIMRDGRTVADGSVETVLDRFGRNTVSVSVDGRLPADARERLRSEFETVFLDRTGRTVSFESQLSDPADVYELLSILERAGVVPVTIETSGRTLEEAFVQATDGERIDGPREAESEEGVES